MNKSHKEQNQIVQIEKERKDQSICGTIFITFEFKKDCEVEYNFNDSTIRNHYLKVNNQEEFILPKDLNINFCYSNQKGIKVQLDIWDYEILDISDYNTSVDYDDDGMSQFYVEYIEISPNHQFIFISIHVLILSKVQSYRLIVIDIKNFQTKKFFYTNHFLSRQKPQFTKDSNVAIINISKSLEESRYLFFDLKDGIINVTIFEFDHQILRIDYDDKSQCLFYITEKRKIIQQAINFEDYTLDESRRQKFKISPTLNEFMEQNIRLYLLNDSIALLLSDSCQMTVIRIAKNYKAISNNFFDSNSPVFIFNKAFIVTSELNFNDLFFIDILKRKLIRKRRFPKSSYQYSRNGSYYISQISNEDQEVNSDYEDSEMVVCKSPKWLIFDIIRGTEKEVNQTKLINNGINMEIFTHEFVAQIHKNNISFQLKL